MPTAIFFIIVIIATSFSLTIFQMTEEIALQSRLLASTAAFYAASSSVDTAWSQASLKKSTDLLQHFPERIQKMSFPEQQTMELNQGILLSSPPPFVSVSDESLIEKFFQSGAEVFLYNILPEQAIQFIRLDCGLNTDCPELIIEWFELQHRFHFQDLKTLVYQPFDLTPINSCLSYSVTIGIKRCAVRTSSIIGQSQIHVSEGEEKYKKVFRLETRFETGNHYIFRFRSIDLKPFYFSLSGERGGNRVPLPMMNLSVDATANGMRSFRRIREQHSISSGLQDGLEFVHYGEEVMNK